VRKQTFGSTWHFHPQRTAAKSPLYQYSAARLKSASEK
jgi:hypothetical protein